MTESDTNAGRHAGDERDASEASSPAQHLQDDRSNAIVRSNPPPDRQTDSESGLLALPAGRQMLDPNWVPANRIKHWISGGIISALGIIYLFAQWIFMEAGFVAGVIVAIPVSVLVGFMVFRAHFYPALWYRAASYELTGTAIEIRTGVLFKSVMTVPRSRVQHTDVGQGPLMRRYGIASLAIHTAGTQHARVVLSGLAKERAEQIRDHLIARVADGNSVATTHPAPTDNASGYGRKESSAETQEADGAT